jgi:hypothetical protein
MKLRSELEADLLISETRYRELVQRTVSIALQRSHDEGLPPKRLV